MTKILLFSLLTACATAVRPASDAGEPLPQCAANISAADCTRNGVCVVDGQACQEPRDGSGSGW